MADQSPEDIAMTKFVVKTGLLIACGIVIFTMAGCPAYNVYTSRMQGEAELARAEGNKQIATSQAKAKAESAVFEAQAEVTRAKGVAAANTIIGDSLKDNEAYLRYLWIVGLETSKNATVYVPTEANLPILEANRLRHPAGPIGAKP